MTERARLAERRVRALWRRVAVQLGVAAAAGLLAGFAAMLLVGWALRASPLWQRPSPLPLLLLLFTLAFVAAWVGRIVVQAAAWDRRAAAAEIERAADLPRGEVQGAVEPGLGRPGTSRALVDLHRLRLAERLAGRSLAELGDALARRARSYVLLATISCMTALALTAAVWVGARASARQAWAAVLHPVRHLESPPLPPLMLIPAADRVRRGDDLAVEVRAPGRDSVRLFWQPQGAVARWRGYPVIDGSARATIPQVEVPVRFWASAADGALSDTLRVVPLDPLLLIDVHVALQFPPHTRREREVNSSPLPVMVVPEGTRATVTGVATRALGRVALRSADGRALPFEILEDRRFRAAFTVRTGAWGWDIIGSQGDGLEGEPDSLYFFALADSAPKVRVLFPGVDTELPLTMTQALTVDVRDDYGLSQVELLSWRVSAWGERWETRVETLPLADDGPRANPTTILDARGRGFLPGDTLRYLVRAYDNAPIPQMGQSREFVLRLPTLDQVRERTIAGAQELVDVADRLAESARKHQESAEALDRAAQITPPPGARQETGRAERGVEFRETEAVRRAVEQASELLERAEEVQDALRELQDAIERAGLTDERVLERLREIEALYEKILTPDLKAKLETLREALAQLDPEQIREAIRELARGSVDFREQIERSVDLLRRAALEHEFATLETQAEELAAAQDQLAEAAAEAAAADSAAETRERLENQARQLAEGAESLAQRLERFVEELGQAGEQLAGERTSEAGEATAEAARADRQTAQSMGRRPRQAASSAARAADLMRQATSALREGREQMQENWRREVVEALDRAGAETIELARRQQRLNEQLNAAAESERAALRSEQVALKRGVDQIEEQLAEASQSSLLIDPSLLNAVAQAQAALGELLEQLSDGTRRRRINPGLGSQVSEGLNELAYRLMQAGEAAAAAASGTGVQEALERLAQLAEQQGEINARAGGMTPGAATQAVLQALQALAARQRSIGQELRGLDHSVGPRGQVLGQLDALAREAEEIASQLERGRLDEEIVRRQGELFQRLVDAGRSLERDDLEKERRAERPTGGEVARPGDLPPELLGGPRYPHPTGDALALYPPAFRRLILEYFDRLNEREDGDGS